MTTTLRERLKATAEESSKLSINMYYRALFKNAQSALLMLADTIKWHNGRYYTDEDQMGNGYKGQSFRAYTTRVAAGHVAPDELCWRTAYQNIAPIFSNDTYAADVANSLLVARGGHVSRFFSFEISSAQQALLVPKIRIYKIVYETEPDPSNTDRLRLKRPIKVMPNSPEIVFDAYTKSSDIDAILTNKKGKIPGSGIKSFEWSLKGVNPAEVDANITATLKLFFNTTQDVLRPDDLQPGGTASFLNLILFSPPALSPNRRKNTPAPCQNEEYEGEYFEIKVELGWAVPPQNTSLFTSREIDYIRNAQEVLYLQLTDHKFDFKQDGSSELTIKYRARKKLTNARYDLLSDDNSQDLENRIKDQEELLADEDTEKVTGFYNVAVSKWQDIAEFNAGSWKTNGGKITDASIRKEIQGLKERRIRSVANKNRRFLAELFTCVYMVEIPHALMLQDVGWKYTPGDYKLRGNYRIKDDDKHGRILSPKKLFGSIFNDYKAADDSLADRHQVYSTVIKPIAKAYNNLGGNIKVLGPINVHGQIAAPKEGAAYNLQAGTTTATKKYYGLNPTTLSHPDIQKSSAYLAAGLSYRYAQSGIGQVGGTVGHTFAGAADEGTALQTKKGVLVSFLYLGDILEILLSTQDVSRDIHNKDLAFVTTDIQYINTYKVAASIQSRGTATGAAPLSLEYTNFRCAFAEMNESDRRKYLSSLNLANIPISLELFVDYYKRRVVDEYRNRYYLGDFLADLFHDFLKPAMSDNGIAGLPRNMPVSFMYDVETSKKNRFFKEAPSARTSQGQPNTFGLDHKRKQIRDEDNEHRTAHFVLHTRGGLARTPNRYLGGGHSTAYSRSSAGKLADRRAGRRGLGGVRDGKVDSTFAVAAPAEAYLRVQNPSGRDIVPIFPPEYNAADRAIIKVLNLQMEYSHLGGDYAKNIAMGIPNFVIGIDRGCVKEISFSRVDQPYLREARVAKDRNFGVNQLRELYHCNLKLYGNTILAPGQLIYVEANNVTFDAPNRKAATSRMLGLGGYHLVVDVSNYLSTSGWETRVKALHVAMPTTTG